MNDDLLKIAIEEGLANHYFIKNDKLPKLKKSIMVKTIIRFIDKIFRIAALNNVRRSSKIKRDKVFFMTTRDCYYCNPKAIAEEIIKEKKPWELIWGFPKDNDITADKEFPDCITPVKGGTFEFYKHISSSHIIIDNSIESLIAGYRKKTGQITIETWHGSFGLKRFDTMSDKRWIKTAKKFGKQTDYCVSNSKRETEILKNTFWTESVFLEIGQARNDLLLKNDIDTEKIRNKYKIPNGYKIALYAPSYRDNENDIQFKIEFTSLRTSLKERFGGNWFIIVRKHYETIKHDSTAISEDDILDASHVNDIQELLMIADVGISDYSSWVCDFVITKRPIFLFMPDYDKYLSERGFYDSIESTPFSIAKTENELYKNILSFDESDYINKCLNYLKMVGYINNSESSKDIVSFINEQICN